VCRFLRKACAWKSHIILGFEKKGEKPHLGTKKAKLTALGYKSSILNGQKQFSSQQRLVLKSSSPKQKEVKKRDRNQRFGTTTRESF
jgi:hypothetical protein